MLDDGVKRKIDSVALGDDNLNMWSRIKEATRKHLADLTNALREVHASGHPDFDGMG